jgi:hypothetical protein
VLGEAAAVIHEQNASVLPYVRADPERTKLSLLPLLRLTNGYVRDFAFLIQGFEINVQVTGFSPLSRPLIGFGYHADGRNLMLFGKGVAVSIGRIECHSDLDPS